MCHIASAGERACRPERPERERPDGRPANVSREPCPWQLFLRSHAHHAARAAGGHVEIYAFCRAVDDIADEPGPHEVRIEQMQRWRNDIEAIYSGSPAPHTRGLARAARTFDLAREDFLAVIDGMEMDVVSTIRAPDLATLDLYCDRVASAVGRLSVRVFQMEKQAGLALAYHLGRALQLTNILRDLDEDAVHWPPLPAKRSIA